ncbi:hypothetical protein ALC53_11730 [Atta colombica]|uniref:Uncharacterized protein n=1 Tax=Atta colombica TaxID=520822 RepID=A0A195B0A4_9HYME|nr:hypothetical protein ALC53_11730 [Atta colombica]
MHPISASPKSVKAPSEDAFPLETSFPRSRSKRRPPHVRIANVCPSVRCRRSMRQGKVERFRMEEGRNGRGEEAEEEEEKEEEE